MNVVAINKVLEGSPHIVDEMKNGKIQLVFNTTEGKKAIEDSLGLRQTALLRGIPYCTTLTGAIAMVMAIEATQKYQFSVTCHSRKCENLFIFFAVHAIIAF